MLSTMGPALGAVAVNLDPVPGQQEIVALGQSPGALPHRLLGKLYQTSASQAAEMAMALVAVYVLVAHAAVLNVGLLQKTTLDEERYGAIDGGLGDLLVSPLQAGVKLVHIEVIMGGEDHPDDPLPFGCVAETFPADEFAENLDFTFHGEISQHQANHRACQRSIISRTWNGEGGSLSLTTFLPPSPLPSLALLSKNLNNAVAGSCQEGNARQNDCETSGRSAAPQALAKDAGKGRRESWEVCPL